MEQIRKNALWVYCETAEGSLLPVGFQLLGKAKELAAEGKLSLCAMVLGPLTEESKENLQRSGADQVLWVNGPALADRLEQPYADCLIDLARTHEPEILLVGATPFGRAFAPRVAAALGTGLTADCTRLELDPETGLLLQTRPAFGGNMMATIRTADRRPQMATVRPGVLPTPERSDNRANLISVSYDGPISPVRLLKQTAAVHSMDIGQSKIIVSAGRGIGQKKNMKLVQALADKLGGSVGASRPLVDLGYCPYDCQIGQTGHSVSPDLLICCGISGAVQHLAGIGGAKTIVAINSDPTAPIFSVADYQIVGDCVEVLQALLEALDI